jgi:hypothetical protein
MMLARCLSNREGSFISLISLPLRCTDAETSALSFKDVSFILLKRPKKHHRHRGDFKAEADVDTDGSPTRLPDSAT